MSKISDFVDMHIQVKVNGTYDKCILKKI